MPWPIVPAPSTATEPIRSALKRVIAADHTKRFRRVGTGGAISPICFRGPLVLAVVEAMTIREPALWDDAIRRHDRSVYLSVLALGLAPDRAREIAQSAWTRLMERHAEGALTELELPGLAIRQARFLALTELERGRTEKRVLAAVPDQPAP